MTIYVDVLFAVNMFINYFLLLITSNFAKAISNRLRILAASIVGGLYCVLAFTSSLNFLQNFFCKILITAIISIIAFKFISLKHYFRCTILLIGIGFLFGGLLYGIYFFTSSDIFYINNCSVYFHISPILLVISVICSYVIIQVFTYFLKPASIPTADSYKVKIVYHEKSVYIEGFVDTGNNLTDIFTDTPVVLANYSIIEALLSTEEKNIFRNGVTYNDPFSLPSKIRIIPLSSIGGSTLLPAFMPDRLVLQTAKKSYIIDRVLIAVFDKTNYNSDHKLILNPELIIEKNQGGTEIAL